MKKRLLNVTVSALLVVILTCAAVFLVSAAPARNIAPPQTQTDFLFTDVHPTDYYFEAVLWAVENGVTNGTSTTTFSPNKICTRGQAMTFLWRACKEPQPSSTQSSFTDVSAGSFYELPVLWASEHTITSGTTLSTFSPNKRCTRGQIVTFLWRACGSKTLPDAEIPFTDVNEQNYFYEAVRWAYENEVCRGVSETLFAPNKVCTRAEAVTFLWKARKLLVACLFDEKDPNQGTWVPVP